MRCLFSRMYLFDLIITSPYTACGKNEINIMQENNQASSGKGNWAGVWLMIATVALLIALKVIFF